ncbi:MAG: hypothetical protein V7776_21810 [Halopseudomonas aestusnigri]
MSSILCYKDQMGIKPTHTDLEHKAALEMIELLWEAEAGTLEHDNLELLGILVDNFEQNNPTPVKFVSR